MKKDGVKLQIEDVKGDVFQQLQQVQNFIGQGVDVIIVNLVDINVVKLIMDQVIKVGILLVFVNCCLQVELIDKMVYVGLDFIFVGCLQMEVLVKVMNGKGNVVILFGDLVNEFICDCIKGVEEVVVKYLNIKIVQKQIVKFICNDVVDVVSNWMISGEDIQVIVFNNDEMVIGVLQVLGKNLNYIFIVGVDGILDVLQMLKSGKMIVIIFQDVKGQGEGVVDVVIKLVNGEKVEKIIDVLYQLIIKENMVEFINCNQKQFWLICGMEVDV